MLLHQHAGLRCAQRPQYASLATTRAPNASPSGTECMAPPPTCTSCTDTADRPLNAARAPELPAVRMALPHPCHFGCAPRVHSNWRAATHRRVASDPTTRSDSIGYRHSGRGAGRSEVLSRIRLRRPSSIQRRARVRGQGGHRISCAAHTRHPMQVQEQRPGSGGPSRPARRPDLATADSCRLVGALSKRASVFTEAPQQGSKESPEVAYRSVNK